MLRIITIKEDTTLTALSEILLDKRFRGPQADAALGRLKAMNAHADFKKLRAGTVIFVPDEPAFEVGDADKAQTTPISDFATIVRSGLADAGKSMKRAVAERSAERVELAAVFKSAAFKRLMDSDKNLAAQVAEAIKTMASDAKQDAEAEQTLARMQKAVAPQLEQLQKMLVQ